MDTEGSKLYLIQHPDKSIGYVESDGSKSFMSEMITYCSRRCQYHNESYERSIGYNVKNNIIKNLKMINLSIAEPPTSTPPTEL